MNSIINYATILNLFKKRPIVYNVIDIEYIVEYIAEYLKIKDTFTLLTINRQLYGYDIIRKSITYKIRNMCKYFTLLKKARVLKHFEGSFIPKSLLKLLPILNFRNDFLKTYNNGYHIFHIIDNISVKCLEYPIMIGVDRFKRPFLSMKYKYIPDEEDVSDKFKIGRHRKKPESIDRHLCYLTVYQVEKDTKMIWRKARYYSPILNCDNYNCQITDRGLEDIVEGIIALLTEKKIKLKKGIYEEEGIKLLNCTINNL